VAEGVRVVSSSDVAAVAGIVAVLVTVVNGEVQRRLAQRQLTLAEEQAELRPELRLSAAYSITGKTMRHADGVLEFTITNTGQTTANNVRCDVQLEEPHLILFLDSRPPLTSHLLRAARITPADPYRTSRNVRVQAQGRGRIHYRCYCDEAPPNEGDTEFEIAKAPPPWWEDDPPVPDFALDKTWQDPLRVGEQVTFQISATNSGGDAVDLHLWDDALSTMQYVSHTGPEAYICDQDPIEGHAICRYETANTGETLAMDLTVIPPKAGTFDNSVYLQYVAPQRGNEGKRIDKTFSLTVLPASTEQKQ
jgi:hypothetical protein